MPPRDFSEDGAANAGSGFDPNFGTAGAQTGGKQVGDFGGNDANQWETGQQAQDDYAKYMENSYGGGQAAIDQGGFSYQTGGPDGLKFRKNTAAQNASYNDYENHMNGTTTPGISDPGTYGMDSNGILKYTAPKMFAEGGAIPDDDDTNGSPEQDILSKALSSVDQVLAFGRKLHGLGGGMNEGAIQDTEAGSAGTGDPRYQDFRKSPNVEDRRGQQTGPVEGALNNFAGKAYSIYDRATSPDNPIDRSNPLAKDLGGDDLSADKPAIDTDEDGQ